MRAEYLVRLYPRRWRERYGDDFLATVGHGPVSPRHVVDILFGAIDAWLSREMRPFACARTRSAVTPRDGLLGAAIMLAAAFVMRRFGFTSLAFPVSFTVSMPFWLMKGQPRIAQIAIVGGTLLVLVAIR